MKKLIATIYVTILSLAPAAALAAPAAPAPTIKINVPKTGPSDVNTIIAGIVNVLIAVAGFASLIVIIVAGIMLATSAGNPETAKKAKDAILYAVVGLIIALLAFAIVNFVLGTFTGIS